ncbi:MAG: isocitrate/isopropylmalate dehydrogenase family protein [Lachnospiraceae bacterium]|nr:isocitrate/isopropylmalate dehydrogenase family protein [Lachnospiraceae bacterium]
MDSYYNEMIDHAVIHFRRLLEGQLDRQNAMEQAAPAKDFTHLDTVTIGVCGGDGIGPIITASAEEILRTLLQDEIASGKVVIKDIEGLTLENRMAHNQAVPDDVMAEIKSCDVLLKGPTTTPQGANTLGSANVKIRRELDLYANVRPVKVPELGIDWCFFRENTEGEYALGGDGIEIPGKLSMDFKVTTEAGTRRICRAACEYARANGKTKLAIVTKNNVIKKTDGNFSRICHEVAAEYPEITAADYIADIVTASLIDPYRQKDYEVFVLPNLYGDIITDEAAQLQGGVGTAGSSNVGDQYAMFEAIHGSAPRKIERGEGDYANPTSIIMAAEFLLRHVGLSAHADRLAEAMKICNETEKKVVITGHKDGATCAEFTSYVLETLASLL